MKKQDSRKKNTTHKPGETTKQGEKPQVIDRSSEKATLDVWANADVFPLPTKKANTVRRTARKAKSRSASEPETYVLRETPTPIQALTLDTLCRKICQDVFLKAALIQGHHVTYVPAWETYPLWIEEHIITEAKSKDSLKLSALRKRCLTRYKHALETEKQKLYQLGTFADWETFLKNLEPRREARLIALINRLRDSDYLRDLPQLSPWCPKCKISINEASLLQKSTHVLNGYVKFPFNFGLEEFGIHVSFCIRMPHLWELAGTLEIGITEDVPYLLTQYGEEYLLFAEPQLQYFSKHHTNGQPAPKPIKEIKAAELAQYTVIHPLFPSRELKLTHIPKTLIAKIPDEAAASLKTGVIPLNPAHHQSSYAIAQALNISAAPIFDEDGKFTEEAGQLCGLHLFNAEKFILQRLEKYGYLLKIHNDKIHEPHCSRCNELVVLRPCSKWAFSISKNETISQQLTDQKYWDNYGDIESKYIRNLQNSVLNFRELKVSTQRQWGIPMPILLCNHCDEPLTDKDALKAIRTAIQRRFEFWFGLSIQEILPADTRCISCNSTDFRKEATLIDSYFVSLLQVVDNSDFKRPPGAHTSVMFIPQTGSGDAQWVKWLAEISVISAVLSRSRPIKESQPFKQLMLKTLPKVDSKLQVKDEFFDKYPADVIRLVVAAPNVKTKRMSYKQLQELADTYLEQYQQMQVLFDDIREQLHPFLLDCQKANQDEQQDAINAHEVQTDGTATPTDMEIEAPEINAMDKTLPMDALAISVTSQLLQEVQHAYQAENFRQVWTLLTDFCQDDLRFYSDTIESRPTTTLRAAQNILSGITTALLQRFAPLTPFLAEHFYPLVSIEGITTGHSIFQGNWHSHSSVIGKSVQLSDLKNDEAKAEWEAAKRTL